MSSLFVAPEKNLLPREEAGEGEKEKKEGRHRNGRALGSG